MIHAFIKPLRMSELGSVLLLSFVVAVFEKVINHFIHTFTVFYPAKLANKRKLGIITVMSLLGKINIGFNSWVNKVLSCLYDFWRIFFQRIL